MTNENYNFLDYDLLKDYCVKHNMDCESTECFVDETKTLLIERASWNDDDDVNVLKDIDVREIFREHINDDGLITSLCDVYDEDDVLYGNINDLETVFNGVRDLLWNLGILQKVYKENKQLEMEDCYNYEIA